jgi:hypothetical protein
VAAAKVLLEGVSGGDHCGGREAFQSAHRPRASLEPAMIRFHPVVAVALHNYLTWLLGEPPCHVGGVDVWYRPGSQ